MLTALDADPDTLDEHEKNFVANIREHGWFGSYVSAEGETSNFAYTTGFCVSIAAPEIITFGFKQKNNAHQTFWNVFNDLKSGRTITPGTRIDDILNDLDVMLLPVDHRYYREYLGWSRWFYAGDGFTCLQLIWPDRNNQFPWEPGFELEFANTQPDLTAGNWAGRIA